MNLGQNSDIINYPKIPDRLIECLERDFPDKVPREAVNLYELGILVGQQKIIDKLKCEKDYNEKDVFDYEEG